MTPEHDETFLKGVLHGLRIKNITVDDAYSKMLILTEKEVYSREMIENIFKPLDLERSKKDQEEENDGRDLAFMPDTVKKNITQFLDLQSRIYFRDTSPRIRRIVDVEKIHIETLKLLLDDESIQISTEKWSLRKFTNLNGNCIVEQDRKIRIFKDSSIWKKAAEYLTKFVHWKNLTIDKLCIECPRPLGLSNENSDILTETIFGFPLKVESLIGSNTGAILHYGITKLDEKYIKHFALGSGETQIKQKVFNSVQWEKLETFNGGSIRFDERLFADSFWHFKSCKFHPQVALSYEHFMALKENLLLKNPNLCQMIVMINLSSENIKKFRDLMRPTQYQYAPNTIQFDYPGNPKSAKKLTLFVDERLVWFTGPEYDEKRDRDTVTTRNEPARAH